MVYLDTSVVVALFIPEPSTARVSDWFERSTDTVVSSDWLLTEFASALAVKTRRGELSPRHAKAAWDEFSSLAQSGVRLLPLDRDGFSQASELVRSARSPLRAGDALHLAVALQAGARTIATADSRLATGAEACGLNVERF